MFYKCNSYKRIFVLHDKKLEEKVTILTETNSVTEPGAIAPIEKISLVKVFGWLSMNHEVNIFSYYYVIRNMINENDWHLPYDFSCQKQGWKQKSSNDTPWTCFQSFAFPINQNVCISMILMPLLLISSRICWLFYENALHKIPI